MSDILPYYLYVTKGYGMTVDDINWSCPADLSVYERAKKVELEKIDLYIYSVCGTYIGSAVSTAIEHNLAGKKARSKYVDETLFSKIYENMLLTEEEIMDKKIKEAILTEQRYSVMASSRLPETIIK